MILCVYFFVVQWKKKKKKKSPRKSITNKRILKILKNSLFSDVVVNEIVYETKMKVWKLYVCIVMEQKTHLIFLNSKIEK